MTVRVEFYGIARQRAAVPTTEVDAETLGDALAALGEQFPKLAADCFEGNRLRGGFAANLNGTRFVADPDVELSPTDCLLIFSADVGG